MKHLLDITNEDLASNPIWRYEGDCDKDAVVRPVDGFSDPDRLVYVARTRFTLRDGTVMFGYCSPTDDSGLDYIQPVIIATSSHVRLWYDPPEKLPSAVDLSALLGKPFEAIFPVRFDCLVAFEGRFLSGVVPAMNVTV